MAESYEDPQGTFWIWATLVIVVLSVVMAWIGAHDDPEGHEPATPPAAVTTAR